MDAKRAVLTWTLCGSCKAGAGRAVAWHSKAQAVLKGSPGPRDENRGFSFGECDCNF